jgi:hypothetical protein
MGKPNGTVGPNEGYSLNVAKWEEKKSKKPSVGIVYQDIRREAKQTVTLMLSSVSISFYDSYLVITNISALLLSSLSICFYRFLFSYDNYQR